MAETCSTCGPRRGVGALNPGTILVQLDFFFNKEPGTLVTEICKTLQLNSVVIKTEGKRDAHR